MSILKILEYVNMAGNVNGLVYDTVVLSDSQETSPETTGVCVLRETAPRCRRWRWRKALWSTAQCTGGSVGPPPLGSARPTLPVVVGETGQKLLCK